MAGKVNSLVSQFEQLESTDGDFKKQLQLLDEIDDKYRYRRLELAAKRSAEDSKLASQLQVCRRAHEFV
jgi:hypothetical protein